MFTVRVRRPSGVLDESEVKPPFFPPNRPPKNARQRARRGEGGHAFCFSWRTASLHEAALTLLGANSAVCRHTLHTFPLFAPPPLPPLPPPFPPASPTTTTTSTPTTTTTTTTSLQPHLNPRPRSIGGTTPCALT